MQPLAGVSVLALEDSLAGPYGSTYLAHFGAEVIRVECPPLGDPERHRPPVVESAAGRMSYEYGRVNRNKYSVALDLERDADHEVFMGLAETADVVWENLGPGVLADLGVLWPELRSRNPRLIYASVSGFGHPDVLPSPFQHRGANDLVAQALSGLMTEIGQEDSPPLYLGVPMADQLTAVLAVFGVLLALQSRDATGRGQRVDISMYDVMAAINEQSISYYGHFGKAAPRGASPTSAPYGAYACRDGWFVVAVASEDGFAKFCQAIEAPDLIDDPRFADGMSRARHTEDLLRPRIESWAAGIDGEEAARILNSAGVPSAPVRSVRQLFDCPHLGARKMILQVDDPVIGPVSVAGNPVKISGLDDPVLRPAAQLGAHQQRFAPTVERGVGA